ncbi:glutathione peroxidase [Treponema pectinovorum]|uniref:glutathione peroxidase n=1 Tax=Treponema pectinovorum TaxID=164 RepID=UPI0011F1CD16|nr:glutathione peroxidase [Treponema pectinovorum]
MTIYDYSFNDGKGNKISMENYKGKVLLIVNTATGCGFTPQYEGLEKLYDSYCEKGFEILDFPCNQFGQQAPGTDEEISQFCSLKYKTKFPQMQKIEVNGKNELPLYTYLKEQKNFAGFTGLKGAFMNKFIASIDSNFKNNSNIKWNFTKFLVDRNGNVVERFESTVEPKKIEEKIKSLL